MIVDLYCTIKEAAGDTVVLGCNVVGHLAAGLVEAQRVGYDTSGRTWERARRMGGNSLVFRLAQRRRFFTVDAACVASTHGTDWQQYRQFLDLVGAIGDRNVRSGIDRRALDGGDPGGIEPVDCLHTTTPQMWRSGADTPSYRWFESTGADPYFRDDTGEFVH